MGKQWKLTDFIFLGSKITADGDCSHEIKRCLLLRRKTMTNLDSILRSRNINLLTKVHLVKAMAFPIVMYGVRVEPKRKLSAEELMLLNCGVEGDSWESLGLQGDPISPRDDSVQFSGSVVSDSLRPHESQHARPPCPSPTPGVHSDSRLSSQWCPQTISSSVIPFSSCLQSLPASGSFQMSQLFESGGQSIGVLASTSIFPMDTQGWSPLGWTGWISLQSKGLSRVFSNTTIQKHQFFGTQLSSQSNSHIHTWPLEKP